MKRWHEVAITSGLLLTTTMSSAAYAAAVTVAKDSVNLRSGPGTTYGVVGMVGRGTNLNVLDQSGDWMKVLTPGGQTAWVAGWLVTAAPAPAPSPSPAPLSATVTVAATVLNLRSGPGTTYSAVTQVKSGTLLTVLDRQGDWFKVRTASGTVGWAASWLVKTSATAPTPPTPPPATYQDLTGQLAVASPKSGSLNVRSSPSTNAGIVSQARASQTYTALGKQGDWIKIVLPDGRQGWMAAWLANLRVLSLNDFAASDSREVVALAKSVLVRRLPRSDFDGMVSVPAGTHMIYITSQDGWHRVQTSSGVVGWVDGSAVKLASRAPFVQSPIYTVDDGLWQMSEFTPGSVKASSVNLRSGAGTGYKALTRLPKGAPLRLLGSQSGWYHVTTADGRDGWVAASLVTPGRTPAVATVQVKEVSAQKKLITIQGGFGQPAVVKEYNGGKSLALYLGPVIVNPAALDLNARELAGIALSGNGLLLNFREQPQYRVVSNAPGQVQLELNTAMTSVSLGAPAADSRQVLNFNTLGYVTPAASWDANAKQVVVRFPGTTYAGQPPAIQSSLVQGVTMASDATGLTVRVAAPVNGRFLLRRTLNQVSLELLPAGLTGKTIVVDPGHGGFDPGATGGSGVLEKTVNLAIALKLKALLEQAGARVLMTRTADTAALPAAQIAAVPPSERSLTDLTARVALANQSKADLYISVHNNYDPSRTQTGTAVYWSDTNLNAERSATFAGLAQNQLVSALGRPNDGTKNNDFYVNKYTEAPSVLLENLFLSDPTEEQMAANDGVQGRIAQAVLQALQQYYQ